MRKVVRSAFFLFLGLGLLLIVADEVWRWKNREKLDYLDVKIWTDENHISGSVRGKEKEKAKELIEKLAGNGRVVWFGAPQLSNCILEIWDAWEERFYRVCRGENRKWYVQLPGSSGGRNTERYLEVGGEKVKDVISKITVLLR